jgi:anti-sigma regulatory factor (Ser/Thr protein kinase)
VSGGSLVHEPHDHIVNFFDDDADLVKAVVEYVAAGLLAGDPVVIVATPARRDAIERRVRGAGFDADRAREAGDYLCLDAAQVLSAIMIGTEPDPDRFQSVAGDLLRRLGAGGRRVRAFGEMVALLWDAGNVSGAIELESLWNELAETQQFSLYCAYPLASLVAAGDLTAANRICEHHSNMIGPRSYGSAPSFPPRTDSGTERSEVFVPVTSAAAAARRFVAETLDGWDENGLRNEALVITSELATNAVKHASSAFRITLRREDSCVRIAVQDISPAPPAQRDPIAGLPGGRGLVIVDRLSQRWGTESRADGKTVWAELDV